jgi:hypothetical protein
MELFKIGDFIRSKNPYKGESEKLVTDIKDNYYVLVWCKGKHCDKFDMGAKENMHTEYTESYEKVG